ncbi:MAG: PH domain-containing protein [Thermoleophilaceae bacterium]|nr:PH domain-containing protein [Thermoleophilaceae bacterium]
MRKRSRYLLGLATASPVLILYVWAASLEGWTLADGVFLFCLAIPYAIFMIRLVGVGVDLTAHGLVVQNFFRTRTYAWDQIDHFDAESTRIGSRSMWSSFVTTDGERHALSAVQEYAMNVLLFRTETNAARAIDDLNKILTRIKREGFDPEVDYTHDL